MTILYTLMLFQMLYGGSYYSTLSQSHTHLKLNTSIMTHIMILLSVTFYILK